MVSLGLSRLVALQRKSLMLRNFSIKEFTDSVKAKELRIDNSLPEGLEDIAESTLQMMQGIRDHLSAVKDDEVPITITSGYRCPKLNKAIGGGLVSDHLKAMAVDFRAPAFGTPIEVARELSKHVDALGIGQLINEYPERGSDGWVHVSTRKPVKAFNRVITITQAGPIVGVHKA